ncbi:MAG: polynucleotide adenylyltransferase [Clostridia bacterium]|nr:polynucleotide adenylyltransferase [Clostridia bacterium]
MTYPDYIDEIICRLEQAGASAYIVGGSLRDMLLGVPPHDYDVATSALPEETVRLFSDMRVIETGLRHGTVTVISHGQPVEITTFRIDGSYTDSRHPDSVRFTSKITEDLSRRDFTVNAMAYNKRDGLTDPFGGRDDLKKRLLRAVGDPHLRFSEDALRIMRAFRFSAQLGFEIEDGTLAGAVAGASGLADIARERIGSEFIRLITSPSPLRPLELMAEHGIFDYVLGGYVPSPRLIRAITDMPPRDIARIAALLSDTDRDSAARILRELRLSGKQITGTLAIMTGARMCVQTPADARRLIAHTGIYAADAARLSEVLGSSPSGAETMTQRQQNTPCSLRDLRINGKDIAGLGASGKLIGEVLNTVMERVIAEPRLNDRQTLLDMAKQILDIQQSKGNKNK